MAVKRIMPLSAICENPNCGQPFTPTLRKVERPSYRRIVTRFCCSKCWHVVRVANRIGPSIAPAIIGRKRAARKRLAALFFSEFGELSVRELDIIRRALKCGYNRGRWKRVHTASQEVAA